MAEQPFWRKAVILFTATIVLAACSALEVDVQHRPTLYQATATIGTPAPAYAPLSAQAATSTPVPPTAGHGVSTVAYPFPPPLTAPSGPTATAGRSGLQVAALATPVAPSQELDLVSHLGGYIYAVTVRGNSAYIGEGPELVVLDVSKPSQPRKLGGVLLPDQIHSIEVVDHHAYVGTESAGLWVVDISDPAAPGQVGFCETLHSALGIVVRGEYAYITDRYVGLSVLDVSDPTHPQVVSTYPIWGGAEDVSVSGNYAFVAGGTLHIVDVSNPASPRGVMSYNTSLYAHDVLVIGSYAYVVCSDCAGGCRGYLQVLDVSNPATPQQVGSHDIRGFLLQVHVAGKFAYVNDGNGGLTVVEISDPTTPRQIRAYDMSGSGRSMTVAGTYVYIANGNSLWIWDASNPASLRPVGSYNVLTAPNGVSVVQGHAYVADLARGLQVVDVSDPVSLHVVGTCNKAGYPAFAEAVFVSERYAYIGDSHYSLRVVDISKPTMPREVGVCRTPASAQDVVVSGDYAYVGYGMCDAYGCQGGLQVVDVSNPTEPREVSVYDVQGDTRSVYVAGNYVYMASGTAGLRVLDVSNPARPREVGSHPTHGEALGIFVTGRWGYLADGEGGLRVLDLSNPARPREVGSYTAAGRARKALVSGGYAYVSWDGGLRVIDVSNPARPRQVQIFEYAAAAHGLFVADGYLYVADRDHGLFMLGPVPWQPTAVPLPTATAAPTRSPVPTLPLLPAIAPDNVHRLAQLTRLGKGQVTDYTWSADGKTLAIATWLGVYLYDATTWTQLQFLPIGVHVLVVEFGPNGSIVAGTAADNSVRLWEVNSGILLHTLWGHTSPSHSIAFALDGRWVATGTDDGTLRFWDVHSGQQRKSLGVDPAATSVVSPNGHWLATGGGETNPSSVELWDLETEQMLHQMSVGSVRGCLPDPPVVAFSPDSRLLAIGDGYGRIGVWDVVEGQILWQFLPGQQVQGAAFSPDGSWLAASGLGRVTLWNLDTGQAMYTLEGDEPAFSPDGTRLVTGGDAGIRLWDVATGQALHPAAGTGQGRSHRPVFSPDGQSVVHDHAASIEVLDITNWEVHRLFVYAPSYTRNVAFSGDGRWLATAHEDAVILWDPGTGEALHTLTGYTGKYCNLAFSPDGQILAGLSDAEDSGRVWLWDVHSGEEPRMLPQEPGIWWPRLTFSADGSTLIGLGHGDVVLWDIETGQMRRPTVSLPAGDSFAASSGGRWVAVGKWGGPLVVQDLESGRVIRTLETPSRVVKGYPPMLKVSPDATLLALLSHGNQIRMWDVGTGQLLHTFAGESVAFSTDSTLVAILTERDVLLWDAKANRELRRLPKAWPIVFSPDCSRLFLRLFEDAPTIWGVK